MVKFHLYLLRLWDQTPLMSVYLFLKNPLDKSPDTPSMSGKVWNLRHDDSCYHTSNVATYQLMSSDDLRAWWPRNQLWNQTTEHVAYFLSELNPAFKSRESLPSFSQFIAGCWMNLFITIENNYVDLHDHCTYML